MGGSPWALISPVSWGVAQLSIGLCGIQVHLPKMDLNNSVSGQFPSAFLLSSFMMPHALFIFQSLQKLEPQSQLEG